MPDRIKEINNRFIEKVGIETNGNAYAKRQIIVLDNKKDVYDVGIFRADTYLLQRTEELNASINDVADAYQDRIDANCRTDLFWRIIGITTSIRQSSGGTGPNAGVSTFIDTNYTIRCERLNSAGYQPEGDFFPPPDPLSPVDQQTYIFDPNFLYVLDQSNPVAQLEGYQKLPLDTKFGLVPTQGDNYHGWKVREEPYSEDLLNPVLSVGLGTMKLSQNRLTFDVLQPVDQQSPALVGIVTGGIITCDTPGLWFDDRTSIVSYGTTVVGLGTTAVSGDVIESGQARKTFVVTEDFAMRDVNIPEINGQLTNFSILKGPNDINYNKLALKRSGDTEDELSPYTPQRVCMMTEALIGKGVSIEYNNFGQPNGCQEWNKFLLGYPDPSNPVEIDGDANTTFNIVQEPNVGGGKIWYRDAFTIFPISGTGGGYASEGSVRVLDRVGTTQTIGPPASALPIDHTVYSGAYPNGTCSNLDSAISDKEDDRDDLESDFADDLSNSESRVSKLYQLTNALREERNELNLRIWAYRVQMGNQESNVDTWDKRVDVINDPYFYDILQQPLTPEEAGKINVRGFPTQ